MKHSIKPCWKSTIDGVEVLESEDEIGYFKNEFDRRPSSCTWVKKASKEGKAMNTSNGCSCVDCLRIEKTHKGQYFYCDPIVRMKR